MAAHMPALPSPARLLRQHRTSGIACASQQTPVAPVKRTMAWGPRQGAPAPPAMQEERSMPTISSPMDVVVEDLRFISQRTGLDLLTPLQEVLEAHDQVVAVLNPIAGERMQEELETRISSLQQELDKAHSQVHLSEERLDSTIEELTRLEMAAHGFTAALSYSVPEGAARLGARSAAAAQAESDGSAGQQSSRSSVGLLERPAPSAPSSSSIHSQPAQQPWEQQRRWQQQERGSGRQLHSDLTLPEQLREFWYPVAFSSQLAGNAMVPLELFGQPWVLFRDARGLAACVADACAHRACPLSLGSVVDGCIQCPYHGWQYDGSGACTRMPSTAFCRGVSVSSLPVAESEGFVWVWPGSDVPSDLAPEPTRPPDNFTVHAELTLEVPVEHGLLLENLLDLAHAPFTHTTTFAKGWPVPDVVKFNAAKLLGGNWEPYPIDMAFEPPCMVLSTIGLAQPGKIMRGARASGCKNHLHQLHVCLPAGPGRTRLLYRMSMDFLEWTRWVPGIRAFWAAIAQQVMGEDLVLVAGQQERMLQGADVWGHPVAYDKLGVRYRRWRNSVASADPQERVEIESELRPMSAGELFSIPQEGCQVGEACDVGQLLEGA